MADCPKCSGAVELNAVECLHCGYDFSGLIKRPKSQEFAYSPLADIALLASLIATGLGCLLSFVTTIVGLLGEQPLVSSVVGSITFLIQLGILVVILRVMNLKQP